MIQSLYDTTYVDDVIINISHLCICNVMLSGYISRGADTEMKSWGPIQVSLSSATTWAQNRW